MDDSARCNRSGTPAGLTNGAADAPFTATCRAPRGLDRDRDDSDEDDD